MKKMLIFSFGILVTGNVMGATVTAIDTEVAQKEELTKLTHNEWNVIAQAVDSLADAFNGVIGDNLSVIFPADIKSTGKVLSDTGQFLSSTVASGLNGFLADGTDGAEGLGFLIKDNAVMRIDAEGDVGIGDITPDALLKLDVEGQIGATEICDENGTNCHDLSGSWMDSTNYTLESEGSAASINFGPADSINTAYGLTLTSGIASDKGGYGAIKATSSVPSACDGSQGGVVNAKLAYARGMCNNGVYTGVSGSATVTALTNYSSSVTSYGLGGTFSAGPGTGTITLGSTGTTWLGGVKGSISGEINGTPDAGAVSAVIGVDTTTGTSPSFAGYFDGRGYFSESVGIGDTTPDTTLKLDVEGQIGATEICNEEGLNCRDLTEPWSDTTNYALASEGSAANINFGAAIPEETVYGLTITSAIPESKAGLGALRATSSVPAGCDGTQNGVVNARLAYARGMCANGAYTGVSGSATITALDNYSSTSTSYGYGGSFSAGSESEGTTTLSSTGTTWLAGVRGRISGEINGTPSAGAIAAVIGQDENTGTAPSYAGYFEGRGYFSESVGIGDTSPDETLKLDVEGQIGATEICNEEGLNCRDLSEPWSDTTNYTLASEGSAATINFGASNPEETVYGLTIASAIPDSKAGIGALITTTSIPDACDGTQGGVVNAKLAYARGMCANGVYSGVSGSATITSLDNYSSSVTSYGLGGNFSAGAGSGTTTLSSTGTTWLGGVKGSISGEINGTPSAGAVAAVIGVDTTTGTSPSYAGYFQGDVIATGEITATTFIYSSDRRLKKNIMPIEGALASVKALNGVSFEWKNNDKKQLGFIAQDVEKVLPALVETSQATDLKAVAYGNITAVLVEAIKEQQKQIDDLKAELDLLK